MSIILRTLALVLLLCGVAQATNNIGISSNPPKPPDLPMRGMVLPANLPNGLLVCKRIEDLKGYFANTSEAGAKKYLAKKYEEDRCWVIREEATVSDYAEVVSDDRGNLRCFMLVLVDLVWEPKKSFFTPWLMRRGVTAARCRPE